MDTLSLDALSIVVTHEVGPLIKGLRNEVDAFQAKATFLERRLFWSRVPNVMRTIVYDFNMTVTQCPCTSCALLNTGYIFGSNATFDAEIQTSLRTSCRLAVRLGAILECMDSSLNLVLQYNPRVWLISFTDEYTSLDLDSEAVYELLKWLSILMDRPVTRDHLDRLREQMCSEE